jgi:hypothetical protein
LDIAFFFPKLYLSRLYAEGFGQLADGSEIRFDVPLFKTANRAFSYPSLLSQIILA